jgi:hypothetical protein
MRNSECGLRALNSVSSLVIISRSEIENEEMKLEAANPKSAIRNRIMQVGFSAIRELPESAY